MVRRRERDDTDGLTDDQRDYLLSWVRGMALGLPSETIYTDDHPFAGRTDEEVAAVWRHHRTELLADYDDPHGRAPWPDRWLGIVDEEA